MSIPIVCYAVANPTQRHRFAVARVESDLVCTACGSDDIDLDESVTAKTAAESGTPSKCKFCDKAPVIKARWMASDGNSVIETGYYCDEHRGSASNWSGDVEGPEAITAAKTASGDWVIKSSVGVDWGRWYSSQAEAEAALKILQDSYNSGSGIHNLMPNPMTFTVQKASSKTAAGPIQWTGDTHMGVGFIVGLGPNDSVYEVYSNPNSNPTPCSWARYGPDGDTGPNSQLDAGRGFATMQEAVKAAEANAAQQATASKTAADEDVAFNDTGKREILTDSGGRKYVKTKDGWQEHRYYSDGSWTCLDTTKKPGTNRTIGHTGPDPARIPFEFRSSKTDTWGESHQSARTAYNDPEMAEVKEVASVDQHVTCSTCLTEHTVTAVDPTQPMPACPNCGALTLSPAGSTLARRRTATNPYSEQQRLFATRQSPLDSVFATLYAEAEASPSGVIYDITESAAKGNCSKCGTALWAGTKHNCTVAGLRDDMDGKSSAKATCKWCGKDISKKGSIWESSDKDGADICTKNNSQSNPRGVLGNHSPKSGTSKAAKVAEITRGILATNTGMHPNQARRIAIKTVETYPQVISSGNQGN